ncbi:hypothetical protein [Rhodococcus sp. NPDC057529]|uniref:hypothetical protein n=1 Tax=Rhodococcus sp. NPDC057529 TaxID=3346158 RepID=UPI00366F5FE0
MSSTSENPEPEPKAVFVVSPIGSPGSVEAVNASLTLEYIIRQALPAPEWDVVRADEEKDPGSITHMVISRIVNSDLVVADLSDHNPNVFYELAVAHGYKKPVVTIMTAGQKVPFDIVDMRTVFYDLTNPASVHTARERLEHSARHVLENPTPTNPLVGYEMFSTASNRADASPSDKLEFGMTQILRRLSHIESRLDEPGGTRRRSTKPSAVENLSAEELAEKQDEIRANLLRVAERMERYNGSTSLEWGPRMRDAN